MQPLYRHCERSEAIQIKPLTCAAGTAVLDGAFYAPLREARNASCFSFSAPESASAIKARVSLMP